MKRRDFIKKSSLVATATFIPATVFAGKDRVAANDRVGVGYIGCGRRARQLLALPKNAEVVGTADCNITRAKKFTDKTKNAYQDYRKLLERSDLKAVVIASPDHWHTLHTVHACQAEKDVYCEKPINLTIREGQLQVKAVRHHKRIFQAGSQQRSMTINQVGCKLIREGALGKIKKVIAKNYESPWICKLPAQECPKDINWDMWCGQTEVRPYHKDIYIPRANPGWISFRRYSGGEVTGWGAHGLDQIQCALGMDESGPVEVWVESDPKYYEYVFTEPKSRKWGYENTPNPRVHYKYANGVEVIMDDGPGGGGVFYGTEGKMFLSRGKANTSPNTIGKEELAKARLQKGDTRKHIKNWIDCIISREEPVAPIEIAHRTTVVCHLVNIARWLGRKVEWDPKTETFPNDPEAAALAERKQRAGYEIPVVG
ncbi:MAG: Gfo/Idh/MocA family oxidoreductase [Planctomycetia bacterium]|jgi:predicted dehydrogenase